MGYYTRYTGEIRIEPPLPWEAIDGSPFLKGTQMWPDRDVMLRLVEEPTNTPEGVLIRRYADAVIPLSDESYKGYDAVPHLQELVDTFGPAGHTFTGWMECTGEEQGDMWRLQVVDGRATRVEARIVWPDGTEGLAR